MNGGGSIGRLLVIDHQLNLKCCNIRDLNGAKQHNSDPTASDATGATQWELPVVFCIKGSTAFIYLGNSRLGKMIRQILSELNTANKLENIHDVVN